MSTALTVMKVVKWFAKLGKELKHVTTATIDGKEVDLKSAEISVDKKKGALRIEAKFGTGSPIGAIEAVHPIAGDGPDEIKVDGADVDKDDVDIDYDVHWLRVDLEYLLKYKAGSDRHRVLLTASKSYLS